jgi:hypothetical protein
MQSRQKSHISVTGHLTTILLVLFVGYHPMSPPRTVSSLEFPLLLTLYSPPVCRMKESKEYSSSNRCYVRETELFSQCLARAQRTIRESLAFSSQFVCGSSIQGNACKFRGIRQTNPARRPFHLDQLLENLDIHICIGRLKYFQEKTSLPRSSQWVTIGLR